MKSVRGERWISVFPRQPKVCYSMSLLRAMVLAVFLNLSNTNDSIQLRKKNFDRSKSANSVFLSHPISEINEEENKPKVSLENKSNGSTQVNQFIFVENTNPDYLPALHKKFAQEYKMIKESANNANRVFLEKLEELRETESLMNSNTFIIIDGEIKSEESLWRKFRSSEDNSKYIHFCEGHVFLDMLDVKDILRYTFILRNHPEDDLGNYNTEEITNILDRIKDKKYNLGSLKDRFKKPLETGYSDYQVVIFQNKNVSQPKNQVNCPWGKNNSVNFNIEIQITTPTMFIAKQVVHIFYELERVIKEFQNEGDSCPEKPNIDSFKDTNPFRRVKTLCSMLNGKENTKFPDCNILISILEKKSLCSDMKNIQKRNELSNALTDISNKIYNKAKFLKNDKENIRKARYIRLIVDNMSNSIKNSPFMSTSVHGLHKIGKILPTKPSNTIDSSPLFEKIINKSIVMVRDGFFGESQEIL
jgi:hypothetical protein